ncbi:TIGR03619 family F420-dependent LLM class oxidoreductase [Actinoplanes sp. NBRC 101535]|uniref:TIGR03619 family F420-dependent LLM class oxidoreductase n=1 Tax=Actinoplanes sp. NBRC 101535 TaxID=3032196 RepID=UPI0024A1398D|nr:TIGR03619 family F420-dependent LLM class oxidoreductase [Actinoplanes sp. NBRC 101535]GLY00494.1 LLM class F420-dependent oxidoreductase [Actinoplanes sp. NBRC 101535]
MKFAVNYATAQFGVDPSHLIRFAQHAEECGFEAIYVPEHVVLYRGATFGGVEFPPTMPIADPLETLSFVAAATSRILLGTGVLLLPYHHPVVLAKRLATVDALSGGRMRLLTVGVGSLPGEAAGVGVDYRSRGRRADEAIDVMRLLWAGDASGVDFDGEFYSFTGLVSYPKPVGAPTLPIHIGGSSRAAARRAALRGDGYFPGGMPTPDERAAQWRTASGGGRPMEYTRWGSIEITEQGISGYASQGVTRLVVGVTAPTLAEQLDQLSAFAARLF